MYEILAAIVYTILGTVTLGCGFACLWVIFFVPHALALYYAFQAYNGKRSSCRCCRTSPASRVGCRFG